MTGHEHTITCTVISAELGLVISGAKYGPLLVHTTFGDLLRSLEGGPELTSAHNLSLSREGLVVASYPSHHVAVFTRILNFLFNHRSVGDQQKRIKVN